MTGKITVGTIQDTGGNTVASTYVTSGVAKAYQHHDEDLTTMHKSLNLSSSTDNATGDFTANFTSSWLDARYMYSFGVDDNGFNDPSAYGIKGLTWATSSHRTRTFYANEAGKGFFDQDMACIIWYGDLA